MKMAHRTKIYSIKFAK